MPPTRPFLLQASIGCGIVMAAIMLLANSAWSDSLNTGSIEIGWSDEARAPQSFRIGAPASQRSFLSRQSDGTRISRHLNVTTDAGLEWQAVPGRAAHEQTTALVRYLRSPDGAWLLEQRLRPTGQAYRLRMELVLTRVADAPSSDPETFRLMLGPGLGEVPLDGMGIAAGMYSFVEPIARIGGDLRRFDSGEAAGNRFEPVEMEDSIAWAGLNSRYFALLLAPEAATTIRGLAFGRADSPDPESLPVRYLPWIALELQLPGLSMGESRELAFEVFAGPKSRPVLSDSDTAHDYSGLLFPDLWNWMRGISIALLVVLGWLHALVPNWGLAICLLAVLVRALLWPVGRWALASQQRFSEMQNTIQPRIREIKVRYKGGEQSERILALYEKHDISPLAGLKPLLIVLIQIPIFVAMFHVLGQAWELRQASFLWIDSLAEPDRLFRFGFDVPFFGAWFNLLPVLMAATTLATIKLSPAPASSAAERRRQNIFLVLMAAGFFLLFYPFPAGMVLYWSMANILHIAQYWVSAKRTARDI
ncbi:MAG: membrane protein insertase YidC [Wenzhouxiangellaceae bacterium]|nr:membrane protein insertase YidC [Wenzhouxiangellaceae bacterium]